MKKPFYLILLFIVSCKTTHFDLPKKQDDAHLVMQLVILKTDFNSNDPEQVLSKHKSLYEFPSSRLIEDEYAKWDIVGEDGLYKMEVSYFMESSEGINLGISLQRKMKLNEITYGVGENAVTKPIYEKQDLKTERLFEKDRWYILGQNYRKPLGEYFLLRINSRKTYDVDISKTPKATLKWDKENERVLPINN